MKPITARVLQLERENAELRAEIQRLKNLNAQVELPLGPIEIFSKNKLDSKIDDLVKSTNRFDYSANNGESLFDSIRLIVGDDELCLNGKLWVCYCRMDPEAMQYAVRKWKALDSVQRQSIKHPAAWLTDLFKRAQQAFTKARKSA